MCRSVVLASAALVFVAIAGLAQAAAAPVRIPSGPGDVYLGPEHAVRVTCGWGTTRPRASVTGTPLRIGGTHFSHGIGTHAPLELVFPLGRRFRWLTFYAGVSSDVGRAGTVVLEVWLDGARLHQTPVMRGGEKPRYVSLSVKGGRELRIVGTDSGDNRHHDHVNIGNLRLSSANAKPAPDGSHLVIAIDPADRRQRFTGWGTSLCWWANMVGRWSDTRVGEVVDALVDEEKGLGYTVFRYNIGGGDRPGHLHMQERARIEGYKPSADVPYDWSADATQRKVLAAILKRNPDAVVEAFANSPPWWMTKSGCASGGKGGASNLREECYDAFADYLTEVVRQFRHSFGVRFHSLEPFNEPDVHWWKEMGRQEGCRFSRAEQELLIAAVARKLRAKRLSGVMLVAADENSISTALHNTTAYGRETLARIGRINVHSYHGWEARAAMAEQARKLGKPVWQSESGPLAFKSKSEWDNALRMADVIVKDLRILRCEAWIDWQVIDRGGWGSIHVNWENREWHKSRRYFMHAQFSRFIRPGARIVGSDHPDAVAAIAPSGRSLTVVVLNRDENAEWPCRIDISRLWRTRTKATAYRTSAEEDVVRVDPGPAVKGGVISIILPPASITTILVNSTRAGADAD